MLASMVSLASDARAFAPPPSAVARPVFDGRAWASQQSDVDRDARLVTAARENSTEFRHLVLLYQSRVYGTALRISGSEADAADATQEAFIRAFRALDRFELGRPFAPWICTIAANVSRDQLRDPIRKIARVSLSVFGDRRSAPKTTDPDRGRDAKDLRDVLEVALLAIKPKLREALVLRYVSGMTMEEVAEALSIKESAAKMRIKRGLELLRGELGDDVAELFGDQ